MNWLIDNGWYLLLIAIAGEIMIPFALAPFVKGYRHTEMAISSLGNRNSPVRLPFNLWMLAAGVLLLLSIPAIYSGYHQISQPLCIAASLCVGIFAVGACIFSCFFSVNETKETVTTASMIHGIGSATGFMLLLLVPLLLALLAFRAGDVAYGIISLLSFICALFAFVLFVMADKPKFQHTLIAKEGLWQRLSLLFMYLPLAVLGIRHIA